MVEKMFIEQFQNYSIQIEYPIITFYYSKYTWMLSLDINDNYLSISAELYGLFFKKYNINYKEAREIIKNMMLKHFKLKNIK